MKLRKTCLLSIFFIYIFMLSACGTKGIEPVSPTQVPIQTPERPPLGDGDIPFTYRMIGVSEDIINKYNYRTKECKNVSDLTKYLGDDAPEEYNDDFFADNTLVLVFRKENSGSIEHIVKSIKRSGKRVFIDIETNIPRILLANMSYTCIIICMNNSVLNEDDVFTSSALDLVGLVDKSESVCPPGMVNGEIPFGYRIVSSDKEMPNDKNYLKFKSYEELEGFLGEDTPDEYEKDFFNNKTLILVSKKSLGAEGNVKVGRVSRISTGVYIDFSYDYDNEEEPLEKEYLLVEIENKYLHSGDNFIPFPPIRFDPPEDFLNINGISPNLE